MKNKEKKHEENFLTIIRRINLHLHLNESFLLSETILIDSKTIIFNEHWVNKSIWFEQPHLFL